ncbi:MAG TPA: glycosyl hydrolase 115 family protein [Prolixibacteraceae bacterium]|nr:glycosyl hydrolase 115 family protein [Prolixibacteraceae bacterium]
MRNSKRVLISILTCILFAFAADLGAQVIVNKQTLKNVSDFPLATQKSVAAVYFDETDEVSVKTTARLFADDVERVTGKKPVLASSKSKLADYVVIIGSIEKNQILKELVKAGKLNVDSLRNQWERYTIKTIDNPFPGVTQALVIAGSDRRGASYGVFSVSEAIGVSPWYWWADVPVQKSAILNIKPVNFTSKSPSVKYRGIFINDEDWGLKPWSSNNYEKDLGDIGPKTYAQVCELLLRLKGNMFAPAMHSCTGAFYSHPESKVVADQYGIIITTSHCEPLLFNNAAKSEWDSKRDGDWNYAKNKEVILKKMDNRVREASPYENIYTIAMRGVHDQGLRGNLSDKEKVDVLTQVMADQREVLKKYLKKPANEIPQIFVPYKETMDVYELGLQIADDVSLIWVDDNYGYMKRLSSPEEQKRIGGSGVYYHFSYLGAPHDYLWLNTTPPVLMYEELTKAYKTGATRYWLVNVGDIKPSELGMQTFFDLAWNVNEFDYTNINRHQSQFLARTFGAKYEKNFQDILDNYYRLAWSRKPEFMGWEREWDAPKYKDILNTDYSFQNYNDAQQRLADYKRISDMANKISKELPENLRPAFFEMMPYPVMGSYQMNRKFLLAQLNSELVKENKLANANWAAAQAKAAFDSINSMTSTYNTMLNGKWNGMMALAPGWCAKYQDMPKVTIREGVASSPVDLEPETSKNKLEGCTIIDLKQIKNKVSKNGHTIRLIEGLGYDWYALQLGEVTEQTADPKNLDSSRVEYEFSDVTDDSVTLHVYSLPFWALHKGKSTRYGISVDGQPVVVSQSDHKEYSEPWKDRVMQNGVVTTARFAANKSQPTHTLTLTCGDPGMIIQRIVIDWGGLKKSYVGPSISVLK